MFVEPHFGQYFFLLKASSCFWDFIIDFLRLHFSFSRMVNSLKLKSSAFSPHNGQCCPGWSCLSYVHLVFGHVHEGMFTHHPKPNQSRTHAYYQPCLTIDGGVASFLCFSCFLTPLNLLILTTLPSKAAQYMLFRLRW